MNFLSSDSDNLQGAVLDAMVGRYLEGDSSSWVTGSRGKFCKTRKRRGRDKEVGMLVNIYKGEIEELEPGFSDEFDLPNLRLVSSFY